MNHTPGNKLIRYLLYFLHFFLGINATVGGLLLMIKPDGSLLRLNQDFLKQSPFSDFFLPGLLLFTFIGLLSVVSLSGLVFKYNFAIAGKMNIYPDKHWAWAYSIYTGIVTILWITIQLMLTEYFWLQPVIILTGLSILICSLTPGVMKYYENNNL